MPPKKSLLSSFTGAVANGLSGRSGQKPVETIPDLDSLTDKIKTVVLDTTLVDEVIDAEINKIEATLSGDDTVWTGDNLLDALKNSNIPFDESKDKDKTKLIARLVKGLKKQIVKEAAETDLQKKIKQIVDDNNSEMLEEQISERLDSLKGSFSAPAPAASNNGISGSDSNARGDTLDPKLIDKVKNYSLFHFTKRAMYLISLCRPHNDILKCQWNLSRLRIASFLILTLIKSTRV